MKHNMPFWEVKVTCFARPDHSIYLSGVFKRFISLIDSVESSFKSRFEKKTDGWGVKESQN